MNRRSIVLVAAVLGGLCWLGRWIADATGTTGTALDVARWAGLVLLAVALAGVGAGLVSRSAQWLQAIVAIALPLLVWSVEEVFKDSFDAVAVDGVTGALVIVVALLVSRRSHAHEPHTPPGRSGRAGAHSR